jgi:hypothetical protein
MTATLLSIVAIAVIADLMWFDFDPIVVALTQAQSNLVNPFELYVL